ncbi:YALI0C15323p [Yarrowia lipolytica CLIB122]|uniref:Large ribosomal subunit protein bL33m n=2 Tax=Yarrowia lipolytica TaxID=4952 RepID=B5FVC6_YARLI|nr:mitochondrial 54S ribosomal protein YmL39 [Yarrowia lipolytica CLIB122]AOW02916.1 hypothetical protein YALI1_C21634g [Yarrowia lipolytica]KAJ8053484.1 mitochondrial 54S ribosomal protein YmL39 [Yarrowia lipolytica]QNP96192.1 54S ribosomal protein L39 [Yarrowia lipolytica]CAR64298.1 YALI0C15323p [Yarrowia lipolytica CLIB122]SEI34046.1 YALIA101S04e08944g1_1 [Yarrowia lipolytica]|eukprot:XP_002143033.1 mitochondrial 54S ribosomal protein YmL39 [Yarrowia lipolytica CLIB122]
MAVRSKNTVIKLFSSAKTGVMRTVFRPRVARPITQVKYDPIVKRMVLFEETKTRRGAVEPRGKEPKKSDD